MECGGKRVCERRHRYGFRFGHIWSAVTSESASGDTAMASASGIYGVRWQASLRAATPLWLPLRAYMECGDKRVRERRHRYGFRFGHIWSAVASESASGDTALASASGIYGVRWQASPRAATPLWLPLRVYMECGGKRVRERRHRFGFRFGYIW